MQIYTLKYNLSMPKLNKLHSPTRLSLSLSKLPSCVILLSSIFPFSFHALSFRLSIELIHHPILYGSDVKYLGTKAVSVFRSPGKALQVNKPKPKKPKVIAC